MRQRRPSVDLHHMPWVSNPIDCSVYELNQRLARLAQDHVTPRKRSGQSNAMYWRGVLLAKLAKLHGETLAASSWWHWLTFGCLRRIQSSTANPKTMQAHHQVVTAVVEICDWLRLYYDLHPPKKPPTYLYEPPTMIVCALLGESYNTVGSMLTGIKNARAHIETRIKAQMNHDQHRLQQCRSAAERLLIKQDLMDELKNLLVRGVKLTPGLVASIGNQSLGKTLASPLQTRRINLVIGHDLIRCAAQTPHTQRQRFQSCTMALDAEIAKLLPPVDNRWPAKLVRGMKSIVGWFCASRKARHQAMRSALSLPAHSQAWQHQLCSLVSLVMTIGIDWWSVSSGLGPFLTLGYLSFQVTKQRGFLIDHSPWSPSVTLRMLLPILQMLVVTATSVSFACGNAIWRGHAVSPDTLITQSLVLGASMQLALCFAEWLLPDQRGFPLVNSQRGLARMLVAMSTMVARILVVNRFSLALAEHENNPCTAEAIKAAGMPPPSSATAAEWRQFFRKRARELHPDKRGDPAAFAALVEIKYCGPPAYT